MKFILWFSIFLLGIMAGLGLLMLCGCSHPWWKNYPEDNIVEEIVEDVIKQEWQLDLDLSPNSPE